jgi:hypothetical protein
VPFSASILKVFIASPSDVQCERQVVREVIHEWNAVHGEDRGLVLLPVGWETHSIPEMGGRPQAIINRQLLVDCDLLVGVFWTKLGTPTGDAPSGTVEEIREHHAAGKPVMLYFSATPVALDSADLTQVQRVQEFRKERFQDGLVQLYSSLDGFRQLFARQLAQTVNTQFGDLAAGPVATVEPEPPLVRDLLSDDAKELLLMAMTATGSREGVLIRTRLSNGLNISSGGQPVQTMGSQKQEARWNSAFNELIEHGVIDDQGYQGEVFEVTHRGNKVAEELLRLRGGPQP